MDPFTMLLLFVIAQGGYGPGKKRPDGDPDGCAVIVMVLFLATVMGGLIWLLRSVEP